VGTQTHGEDEEKEEAREEAVESMETDVVAEGWEGGTGWRKSAEAGREEEVDGTRERV